MTHVRTQVRNAVKTALTARTAGSSAYPTLAQDRVYVRGSQPIREGDAPYIKIMTPTESSERLNYEDTHDRTITLEIECGLYETTAVCEDELDAFCVEVETIIDAGITPAFDFEYQGTEFDYPQEGAEEFGIATLTYEVTVHTALGDPETSRKN